MLPSCRRIVTGHDAKGRSIVISDEPVTNILPMPEGQDGGLINFWSTDRTPARNAAYVDPMAGPPVGLLPPKNGTVFHYFQVPPEDPNISAAEKEARARRLFAEAGDVSVRVNTSRHPSMHRTHTVDYIIMLSGELTLLLDEGEPIRVKPFDVVIQRGTNHAWVNHGKTPALAIAIMIDAEPQ